MKGEGFVYGPLQRQLFQYPLLNEFLENMLSTLKLSGASQPFLTMAVPSSRIFGKKFNGHHEKAIQYIQKKSSRWASMFGNFRLYSNHVKIIVDGGFFSLNMQVRP